MSSATRYTRSVQYHPRVCYIHRRPSHITLSRSVHYMEKYKLCLLFLVLLDVCVEEM